MIFRGLPALQEQVNASKATSKLCKTKSLVHYTTPYEADTAF
jgi:hypothetical protein